MEFKDVVRSLRNEKGWSQQDVADRLGVHKMTVSGYETGKRKPSFEMLDALSDVFDVSFDYLLGYSPERGRHEAKETDDPLVLLSSLLRPDEFACLCAYRSAAPMTRLQVQRALGIR